MSHIDTDDMEEEMFSDDTLAVEYYRDGFVIICAEMVEEIRLDKDVPSWLKDLLC